MDPFRLPSDLATELCRRLGVGWPSVPADLAPLYRAWCATIPFDNVSKTAAVAEDRVPPGADPAQVAETYLATGLGGTCWAHVSMLAGLLDAAGARVTVGLDHMTGTGDIVDLHSFVVVHDAGERWMLDPVWASGRPLALHGGERGDHPVVRTGLDRDGPGGRLSHWAGAGPAGTCRYAVLSTVLDREDVEAFCAVSARFSGLRPGVLLLRRTTPAAVESLRVPGDGRTGLILRRRDGAGTTDTLFPHPDDAFAALGCNADARARAERAGLLSPPPPA